MKHTDETTTPEMTNTGKFKCKVCGEYYSDINGAYRCTMEHMNEDGNVKTDFEGMWR